MIFCWNTLLTKITQACSWPHRKVWAGAGTSQPSKQAYLGFEDCISNHGTETDTCRHTHTTGDALGDEWLMVMNDEWWCSWWWITNGDALGDGWTIKTSREIEQRRHRRHWVPGRLHRHHDLLALRIASWTTRRRQTFKGIQICEGLGWQLHESMRKRNH